MSVFFKSSKKLFPVRQLKKYWTIIGSILVVASIAQPIVSSQLSSIPPEDLLKPMTQYMGNRPLPDQITALFGGVFANIQFSITFAIIKLLLGGTVLFAAKTLGKKMWPIGVLQVVAIFGVMAFAGIGLFFVYSSFIIASAIAVPVLMTILMMVMGLVVAFFPIKWLVKNFKSLDTLRKEFRQEMTLF